MKKSNGVLGIVLAIFLVSIFIFGGLYFGEYQQSSLSGGLTIKSITAPNYDSNNPDLSRYNWRVVADVGVSSEKIYYEMTPELFSSLSSSGLYTENPFYISIDASNQIASYTISADEPIADYEYNYVKCKTGQFTPDPCPNGADYQFVENNNIGVACVRHCLKAVKSGYSGILNEPSTKSYINMTLSSNDISISKQVSSQDSVVYFNYNNNNLAKVTLTGMLITGDPLPTTSNLIPVIKTGSSWYFITDNNWNNYLTSEQSFVNIWKSTITDDNKGSSDNLIEELTIDLSNYKSSRTRYLDSKTSVSGNLIDGSSLDYAKLNYELDRRVAIEELVFDINANWVGISIQSGIPSITSLSCSQATSGQNNDISATVKNIGTQTGNFAFSVSGCSEFKQVYSSLSERISVDAGKTKTNVVEVNAGSVNEDLKQLCTVKVYDVENPDNFDAKTVSCELSPLATCVPNQIRTQENCIYKCNSDGNSESQLLCCSNNAPLLNASSNQYYCAGENISPISAGTCEGLKVAGITILPDFGCLIQDRLLFVLQLLGISIIVVVGIISYYAQIIIFKKLKFKRNNVLFIIVSMIISLVLYLLLFELWWLVLIVGVLISIVTYLLSNTLGKIKKSGK